MAVHLRRDGSRHPSLSSESVPHEISDRDLFQFEQKRDTTRIAYKVPVVEEWKEEAFVLGELVVQQGKVEHLDMLEEEADEVMNI